MESKRFTFTVRFDDINDNESIKYLSSLSPKERNTFIYKLIKSSLESKTVSQNEKKIDELYNKVSELFLKVDIITKELEELKKINSSQQVSDDGNDNTENLFANVELFH